MKNKLIDLSHTFTNNMPVYPSDTKPTLKQTRSVKLDGYANYQITTTMHVGTHIDAPFHMIENGKKHFEFSLDRFCGKAKLVDARNKSEISASLLKNITLQKDDVVLVLTGHYKSWGQPNYFKNFPVITEDFALALIKAEVKILGLDTPSPEEAPYSIHKLLFKNNILIIENLTNLEQLINYKNFEVYAFPPKFETDSSPVRVVAKKLDMP